MHYAHLQISDRSSPTSESTEMWYDSQGRHSALGYTSPEIFEQRYFEPNPVSTKSL